MLNNENVKKAEHNMKQYLSEDLISKSSFRQIIFNTFMKNHKDSLLLAKKIYNENLSPLWVIVISYYSMFYIANAVLYKLGYKIGSKIAHKITSDALIVFIRNKLKEKLIEDYEIATKEALIISNNLIENFEYERRKREVFQYETTEEIKKAKAKTSLKRAEEFSKEIEKLLLNLE